MIDKLINLFAQLKNSLGDVVNPATEEKQDDNIIQTIVIGNKLASLTKTEDTPHVSGDKGIQMLAVRNDDEVVVAANGDYIPLSTDSRGRLHTNPTNWYFQVGEKNISDKGFIHKFGRNPDIDSGFEAIWNGGADYTGFNATVAQTIDVLSSVAADAGTLVSSGTATGGTITTLIDTAATFASDGVTIGDIILNDTQIFHGSITAVTETILTVIRFDQEGTVQGHIFAAGDVYRIASPASTGASVVEVQNLLDANLGNETSEFVILNGTTPVATVEAYLRCSRIGVINAGSGGGNAGVLTARQTTTVANVFAVMPIGYNQTMISAYTIPITQEGHLTGWYAGLAGKTQANCNIRLIYRHVGEVFQVREEFSISGAGTSYVQRDFKVPKNDLPPGTDIKIMADSDTVNTAVAAGFDLILSTD